MNPRWPAFIHYSLEPSLTFVSDGVEWDSDPDLSAWPYELADRLIDADGWEYRLLFVGRPGRGRVTLEGTGTQLGPVQLSALVEGHLLAAHRSVSDYRAYLERRGPSESTRAIVEYLAGS